MKRSIAFLLCVVMAFALFGCGQQTGGTSTAKYADKSFLNDLSAAFERRQNKIDSTDTDSYSVGSKEYTDFLTEITDIESDALGKYRTQSFEDGKLQEYAIKYINMLDDSKAAAAKLPTDYASAAEAWQKAYNERCQLLSIFINDYGLTFDDKYKTTIEEILSEAKDIDASNKQDEKIQGMLKGLTFSFAENNYGYKKYTAILKNDSGVNFSYISLTIDLLDSNGVVVEQQYASLSSVSNGKSYNVEFTTDKDFTSYDVTPDYAIDK